MRLKRTYVPETDPARIQARARLRQLDRAIEAMQGLGIEVVAAGTPGATSAQVQLAALITEHKALAARTPPRKVNGVHILHAVKRQKFDARVLDGGKAEGWLTENAGRITVKGHDTVLVYQLVSNPGYYCCHCEAPQGDSTSAQQHVARDHVGETSPDPQNPSGYRKDEFYVGMLVEGAEVTMDAEAYAAMNLGIRQAFNDKIRPKFGGTRDAAVRRWQAKDAAGTARQEG